MSSWRLPGTAGLAAALLLGASACIGSVEGGGADAAPWDGVVVDGAPGPAIDAPPVAPTIDAPASDPWESYRQACVDKVNELRATRGLTPYSRWTSAEQCVDDQATHDQSVGIPHDAFATGSPACGGYAQNECPGWGASAITSCLEQMWAEREQPGCAGCDACDTWTIFAGDCPDCEFNGATVCGHYVNMSSQSFSTVACGFSDDGSWAAQNYQ